MNSTNKAKVEDELKKLTSEYIKATHSEDKQLAKNIMQSMEELKKLFVNGNSIIQCYELLWTCRMVH